MPRDAGYAARETMAADVAAGQPTSADEGLTGVELDWMSFCA